MTWKNDILYWTWVEDRKKDKNGNFIGEIPSLPTTKKIDYVTINKNSTLLLNLDDQYLPGGEWRLAIGVWDDEKYTPLHRDQLESCLTTYVFSDTPIEYRPPHGILVDRPKYEATTV